MHKIVTLNGCFDKLHAGHMYMLGHAGYLRAKGYKVIVCINSDAYIRKHKREYGQSEEEREKALLATGVVDEVFVFCSEDPRSILTSICPDVHIMGEEYKGCALEEETLTSLGCSIVYVPRVGQWSTTKSYQEGL